MKTPTPAQAERLALNMIHYRVEACDARHGSPIAGAAWEPIKADDNRVCFLNAAEIIEFVEGFEPEDFEDIAWRAVPYYPTNRKPVPNMKPLNLRTVFCALSKPTQVGRGNEHGRVVEPTEANTPLARDMPAAVHALNNTILTQIGV